MIITPTVTVIHINKLCFEKKYYSKSEQVQSCIIIAVKWPVVLSTIVSCVTMGIQWTVWGQQWPGAIIRSFILRHSSSRSVHTNRTRLPVLSLISESVDKLTVEAPRRKSRVFPQMSCTNERICSIQLSNLLFPVSSPFNEVEYKLNGYSTDV